MPNLRIKLAKNTKLTNEMMIQANSVSQKPNLGKSNGKNKNIGKVGTTYQNVYHA